MKNKKSLIFAVGISVAMISGFMAGQFAFNDQSQADATPIRALVPESARKLAIPDLQQGDGSHFNTSSLQGKWSILFFGYTHCPDVCPTTLSDLAQVKREYAKQSGKPFPQVVFISVDPQRDTPEILGKYVSYFDKDFIGATGEEKLLTAITVQVHSTFVTKPSKNENEYQVGHSLNLILINPDAELVAVLRAPHSVKTIMDALQYFIDS